MDPEQLDETEVNVDSLRKGKWSLEEEQYANRIIALFNQGTLRIPAGTTLRTFLSDKLRCDPMRITKKFAGSSSIGKQLFQPCELFDEIDEALDAYEAELQQLEAIFLQRLANKKQKGARRSMDDATLGTLPSSNNVVVASSDIHDSFQSMTPLRFLTSSGKHAHAHHNNNSHNHHHHHPNNSQRVYSIPFEPNALSKLSAAKRVVSAPNLTALDTLASTSRDHDNNNDDEDDLNQRHRLPAIGEEFNLDAFRARQQQLENNSSKNNDHTQSNNSTTGWKRSRSVMAFMDFEKLAADEKAAGTLFFEFVTNLKMPPRAPLSVTSNNTTVLESSNNSVVNNNSVISPSKKDVQCITNSNNSTTTTTPTKTTVGINNDVDEDDSQPPMKRVVSFAMEIVQQSDSMNVVHSKDVNNSNENNNHHAHQHDSLFRSRENSNEMTIDEREEEDNFF